MRLAITLVLLGVLTQLVSCVGPKVVGSLHSFQEECKIERTKAMRKAWNRFEFKHKREIIVPDWRLSAHRWAEVECKVGRAIPNYWPPRCKKFRC